MEITETITKTGATCENGQWYLIGARYYDPEIARWISCDPAGQFHSPYTYSGNGTNPISSIDSDGKKVYPISKTQKAAYSLLQTTKTGQDLIARANEESGRYPVYLTMEGGLADDLGNPVKGLTHIKPHLYAVTVFGRLFEFFKKTVYAVVKTNSDISGDNPVKVVENVSFELENVMMGFENPDSPHGIDSPNAKPTQQKVMGELNSNGN